MLNGYGDFNCNFDFDGSVTGDTDVDDGRSLTSSIDFGNWNNLDSPIMTDSNDQFADLLHLFDANKYSPKANHLFLG